MNIATQKRQVCNMEIDIVTFFVMEGNARLIPIGRLKLKEESELRKRTLVVRGYRKKIFLLNYKVWSTKLTLNCQRTIIEILLYK